MKTRPADDTILELVKKARSGKIILPQFQRNFVWGRDDVTDLLISILEGYFIGSFLMLDTDADNIPFAVRPIEGVDLAGNNYRPEWMVLDGQQRLTSLNYVLAAPDIPMRWTRYPYRFFLDLNKVAEGDLENAIWSERSDRVNSWLERDRQFETLTIPFTVIEEWDSWIRAYETWLRDDREAYDYYWDNYRDPWADMMFRLKTFNVPIIAIEKGKPDDPEHLGQVCAIFEKMNSTGVRLSVYDLLTARLYRDRIDLHQMWEKAVNQYDLLNEYSEGKPDQFGVYMLRTLALMRGKDAKSKTLINLDPEGFEEDWEAAAYYMEQALQRITSTNPDGFGAFDPKWLPYTTIVSPMAALLAVIDRQKLGHQAYKLLRRWYWASVFRERYSGAVESTIHQDYRELTTAFENEDFTPSALADAQAAIVENPRYGLIDVSRLNSVYRSVMCLVALRGARDFRADDSIEFHALDDHHIFPKAYLRKQTNGEGKAYASDMINSIVNRTLISSGTNRSISKSSPSGYLEKIVPDECMDEIMASHFINADALQAMRENDFESFLLYREKALVDEVRRQLMG